MIRPEPSLKKAVEGKSVDENSLLEIIIRAREGESPGMIAQAWACRLHLRDGVCIAVLTHHQSLRPRRYTVRHGRVVSPQQYKAMLIAEALESVVRCAGRPLDSWGILSAAREQGSPVGMASAATIGQAARLLEHDGHLRRGPLVGTWIVP